MEELKKYTILDAHMHSYGMFMRPHENVLEYMDANHVAEAIITTINRQGNPQKIVKNDDKTTNEKQGLNDALKNFRNSMSKDQLSHENVLRLMEKAPKRVHGFFWFNPNMAPELKEQHYQVLQKHFEKGFRGVKVHAAFHFFKTPNDLESLASFMQEQDPTLLLFMHSNLKTSFLRGTTAKDIAKLAKKFPNLRIIVGHAACTMEYAIDVMMMLKKFQNVYFETSCSQALGLYNLIKSMGHERVLFGSDSPTTNPFLPEALKITSLPIGEEQKQDILYDNAKKLLNP